jgi:cytochrome c biogenesis protein CcmG, thiol:disulfide interchange protein DsbE
MTAVRSASITAIPLHLAFRLALLLALAIATLPTRAAGTLDLERYRGKVVLLDFWASWCEPCRHSFPWLNEMQAKYASQGLVVIAVNVDRERAEAERFLRDVPARFEVVYDPAGALAEAYDVPGMPVSYVIGRDGEIIGQHVGFRSAARAEREAELQRLLGIATNR